MHITILTIGSRGDVQPFIALGMGLQEAGYRVKLASHANFESMVKENGLDFAAIEGNPQEMFQGESARVAMKTRNPIEFSRRLSQVLHPIMSAAQLDSWAACQDTDVIVAGSIAFWAVDIAERLQVPCFYAFLQPAAPTTAFPASIAPPSSGRLGGLYNRLTYSVLYRLIWLLISSSINQFRQSTLQLPLAKKTLFNRMRDLQIPLLSAVSPSIVSIPKDWTALDYMAGYWFLDSASDFTPSVSLLDFLADGLPPVYIGFGSMIGPEVIRTIEIALEALIKTGQRGLLMTGWSGFSKSDLPSHIHKTSSIPHDWLFPKMQCVIHHGGAGTTAATFRSGIPGIPIAFIADQPFWAYRAYKLGVSPAPIDRRKMTVEQLAEAILETIHDSGMRNRATELGKKIRQENGVAQAVNIIDKTIKQGVLR